MNTIETFDRVVAVGVDMQNDFAPGGALAVQDGDQVVPVFNQVADWVRDQNGIVAFTRDQHPAETKHFQEWGGPWVPHCVVGTPGADFINGLEIQDGDPILNKGMNPVDDGYSGFDGVTHDEMTLEAYVYPTHGERVALVLGGLATDYCDKATVMDGLALAKELAPNQRTLAVFVVKEAVKAVDINLGDGDKALTEMAAAGARIVSALDLVHGRVLEVRN